MPDYLIEFLLDLFTPLAIVLGTWIAAEVGLWLRAHVSHTQTREALERATAAAGAAVGEVAQVYVSALRKSASDGKLTPAEAGEAQARALAAARDYLGPKGVALLRSALGSDDQAIDRWLVALIEERIAATKGGKS
jgi:hypothetical protein